MHSFFRLLYFICCISSLFFNLNSFAQSLCKEVFSAVESGGLIKSARVGSDLLQNAEIKLEQDLQVIRNSPQEPLLKEQGFKPEYYRGVDQAREFNRVRQYLQEIKADPKHTHIQYFSDQIDKTLSDFEKSFRKYNKNNPEFLEERLKVLEEVKKEARKRMEDQNVTYDWWATFNLRLSMIASNIDFSSYILSRLKHPHVRDMLDIEVAYNKKLAQKIEELTDPDKYDTPEWRRFKKIDLERIYPANGIMIRTSDSLEDISFLLTGRAIRDQTLEDVITQAAKEIGFSFNTLDNLKNHQTTKAITLLLIDFTQKFLTLKARNFPEYMMFFIPDKPGIMAFNRLEGNFISVLGSPIVADGTVLGSFDLFEHDLIHAASTIYGRVSKKIIIERIDNIPSQSDREKAELFAFMYSHENLPLDANSIDDSLSRFFDPTAFQGILPDSVNINNREEVVNFLKESADIFADIFADILLDL